MNAPLTTAPAPAAATAGTNPRVNAQGERIRAASLALNPRLHQWLRFDAAGFVEARPGKVEIGQGIVTALAQIVAEELDLALERVRMLPAATSTSPDEAVTSGSLSIQESGSALRQAAAHARALFLDAAAAQLRVTRDAIVSEADGRLHAGAANTSYWALAQDVSLDVDANDTYQPKTPSSHRLVGQSAPRRDLPEKVFGTPRLIHDFVLPGMLHGRVVRPGAPGAVLEEAGLAAALDAVRALPGVISVVRDGSFLGVIAESELQAAGAASQLEQAVQWRSTRVLPDAAQLPAWLRAQPLDTRLVDQRGPAGAAAAQGARTVKASYSRGFVAHASIGPSCALACWREVGAGADTVADAGTNIRTGSEAGTKAGTKASIRANTGTHTASGPLEVWTHSQGIFNLRTDLALAFAREPQSIIVHHVEGAGCYGHNGADDVAYDAALLARAVPGRTVRLQWTRAQELGWAPFSPAMCVDLEATLDADGNIVYWKHDVTSNGHGTRPGRAKTPALLAATHLEKPFEPLVAVNAALASGGGSERNAVPLYDFPAWTITNHRLLTMPIRTSAMRSLGAHCNVFALESFIDEIAHARGEDAVAFRLRQLSDPRAIAVIERAAGMAGWGGAPAQATGNTAGHSTTLGTDAGTSRGRGIAFAKYKNTGSYCAVVADVEVAREVRVKKFWIAVDVGLVINPDGVLNQVEGGAIQAASMTLKEAVAFDAGRITSDAWEHYPIFKFSEVPEVEVSLISRPDLPSVGAGEAAHGPVAAAIGNAVFNAIGVRVRDMPMTPERIVAAMA